MTLMLGLILLTFLLWPDESPVSRYDFLVVGAVIDDQLEALFGRLCHVR